MPVTRRQVLRTALAAGAAGLGLGLYASPWEPHWLEFVHHRICPCAACPQASSPEVTVFTRQRA